MKKFLFTFAFMTIALISQAQLFIGGNIGANYDGGNADYSVITPIPEFNEEGKIYLDRKTSFQIAPMIGYKMSEKVSLGLSLNYSSTTKKSCSNSHEKNYDIKNITREFGFAPFFRYTVLSFNNLKIFADAKLPISFARGKGIIEENNTTIEINEPKQFNIGILIVPGLMYEITDNLAFVSELGLLNLGWSHQRTKTTEEIDIAQESSYSHVQKNNQFGIGINNHVQATIGFIYTF